MGTVQKPKLAVYKFSSCDGCQLSLLNMEDEILAIAEMVDIAYFLEATRRIKPGPYDIALVEGSVTCPEEIEKIKEIRGECNTLIAFGTCATSGGVQALKNFQSVAEYSDYVYPHPEYIETLDRSTPISEHVKVDMELWGCPVDKSQVLEVLAALLQNRKPNLPNYVVCMECKRNGDPCVMVAKNLPCLGPITRAGCGALCPGVGRGCFGCFGPLPDAQVEAFVPVLARHSQSAEEAIRLLRTINSNAPEFIKAAELLLDDEVIE